MKKNLFLILEAIKMAASSFLLMVGMVLAAVSVVLFAGSLVEYVPAWYAGICASASMVALSFSYIMS